LEIVWFTISAGGRDLKQFVNGEDNGLNGLNAVSKLQVGEYFEVTLKKLDDNSWDILDDDMDELREEYEAILLDYMLPHSLRSQTPETEEQRYLQARADPAEETALHPSAD
jgi:hypothetical protein